MLPASGECPVIHAWGTSVAQLVAIAYADEFRAAEVVRTPFEEGPLPGYELAVA
jgi:hypothetical protein